MSTNTNGLRSLDIKAYSTLSDLLGGSNSIFSLCKRLLEKGGESWYKISSYKYEIKEKILPNMNTISL